MVTSFRRLASLFALVGSTAFAQLVSTNLQLEFNAATDPQGDTVWTDTAGVQTTPPTLTFASTPVRSSIDIASSNYPGLNLGYVTPAYGLNGFFDSSTAPTSTRSSFNGTFELWLNVTSLSAGSDQVIFEAGGDTNGLSFTLSDSTLKFNVDGLGQTIDATITKTLTLGMHHVVGVLVCSNNSAADDSMSLYVDGSLVQTISGINIGKWAGGNISAIGGVGLASNSITGVGAPISFHGQIASLRYYNRALTAEQIESNNAVYARIATYVTGQSSSNNFTPPAVPTSFTPTKTRTINGELYGFQHVISDGTDGLKEAQFKSWDLYKSTDGGLTWTKLKTLIDRTTINPATSQPYFDNTIFQSVQFQVTPGGFVALYMKNLYANTPAGETDNRKFLTCIISEVSTANNNVDAAKGNYRVAFNERPFGEPSGDLGNVTTGGQLYIVSANTTDGYINIFNVGANGDRLVALTMHKQWLNSNGSVDHREAPSLFYQSGYWFLTTSGRTGWRPNQHKYSYATSLSGPWSDLIDLGDSTGYHSQLFFTATVGANRIFSATRNAPMWLGEGGSRPVWLPMRFNRVPDILATNYYDEVVVNYTKGTAEGFHYDRGRQLAVSSARLVGATDNINAIVDGDEATFWSNGASTSKRLVEITLTSSSQVKALKIKPYKPANYTFKVKIYVGDGTNFTQVFPQGTEPPIIPNYAFLGPIDVKPTTGQVIRIENYASYGEDSSYQIAENNQFGLYEVQVWGGSGSAGYEVNETFDTSPSSWISLAQAGTTVAATSAPGNATAALKFTDTSATNRAYAIKNFTAQNGSMVAVEWKYRTENARTGEYLRVSQGSTVAFELTNALSLNPATGSATLAIADSTGAEIGVADITTGAWHAFRLEVNTDTDTFDLYIDGQLSWLGGKLRNPVNSLDKITLGTSEAGSGVVAHFDDVKVDGPNVASSTTTQDLNEQIAVLNTELQVVNSQLVTANSRIATLESEKAALTSTITQLNGQITTLTSEKATLVLANENLTKDLAKKDADLKSAQESLAAAKSSILALEVSLKAAQDENAALKLEKSALQASLTAANAQIATLTNTNAQLTASLAQANLDKTSLQTSLTAANGQITTLTTTNTQLNTSLTQANLDKADLQSKLDAAAAEIAALKTEKTGLLASLATANSEISTLTTKNTQLTASLAQANLDKADLQTRLTAANSQISALQTSLATANGEIATLNSANTQLNASLTQANADKTALQASLTTANAQIASLTTTLAATNAAKAALTTQVTTMTTSLSALATLLGQDNKDAAFKLPGTTPEGQLSGVVDGVNKLNHGEKQALYKALGGKL